MTTGPGARADAGAVAGTARAAGRLRPEKREAILAGGREVFARDGYERASVEAIATAAGVSSRTLYKHFDDKSNLFAAVIAESAAEQAAEQTSLIGRLLSPVRAADEVEPTLVAFASELVGGGADSAVHRALVRQVDADATHLGEEVVAAWWWAGPGRVQAELSAIFARWSELGLLTIGDPERAAVYFSRLVTARPGPPGTQWTGRSEWIADGVAVFVHGYRP